VARLPDPQKPKTCRRCRERHPRNRFPHGRHLCRKCHNAEKERGYGTRWKRNQNLRNRYGISLERYEAMHRRQRGRCAICREFPRGQRPLMVDHRHHTTPAFVRDLLCTSCNTAIGQARESVRILRAMVRYVERWEKKRLRKGGR
jgi:hypothetical protein